MTTEMKTATCPSREPLRTKDTLLYVPLAHLGGTWKLHAILTSNLKCVKANFPWENIWRKQTGVSAAPKHEPWKGGTEEVVPRPSKYY